MESLRAKQLVSVEPNSVLSKPMERPMEKPLEGGAPAISRESKASLTLERRVDGQLWASYRGEQKPVWVSRCFPWSEPFRFISLRDADDEEFVLVRDPEQLDRRSRAALETSLAEAGFVLEIIGVESCEEEVEIRRWVVLTRQGRRSFQTRRDEWPRDIPGGGLLISDVSGDLFHVPDSQALDAKSRALLWAFVD
jgi:hypothetical protein